jgi:L-asparaginase II
MEAIRVEARRGDVVEATHSVHAVVVRGGTVLLTAGATKQVAFLRSSAKPFQALPLARARANLDDELLAIASASHRAEPAQIAAVERLLAAAPARADELECGPQEGRPPDPLYHNCSGKHAGMLALARAKGWPTEGYRLPEHEVQRTILAVIAEAAEVDESEIPTATDGCGVPTHALPLERMARMFSRLESLPQGARIVAAMRRNPELVGGAGATDSELMRLRPGWAGKGGAEGLFCAAGPEATGLALKTEDGSNRAHRAALAALFAELGEPFEEFRATPIRNSRGEQVGELVPAPS